MDKMFNNIYQDKNVLVTGHTGFKGSWLSLWLTELGANVIGYSLEPPSVLNLFEAVDLEKRINHIHGDIRNQISLDEVFKKYKPEFVFHLAAQALVRRSYKEPRFTYETNVMGTINVLEAIRKTNSVKSCIIVTSDKCYENKERDYSYKENDPMGGYDPYSSSKGCVELITNAYRRSFFNPKEYGETHTVALSSARAGNVIGGGDWGADRIMPDCIRALSRGDPIVIRNPSAIRPWQHVLEPLYGYLLLGAIMYEDGTKYSSGWNFGPNDENIITVEELVKLVIKKWGPGPGYLVDKSANPHEAVLLKLDNSKASSHLLWTPRYGIHETITRTVEWYRYFYEGSNTNDLFEFTRSEIDAYINYKE